MPKEKLFSITREDCEWQYFRSSGNGGQNKNKVNSACRCIHRPSGAVGEGKEERDQLRNRRAAFRRMAESKEFQTWLKLEVARVLTGKTIDQIVDEQMDDKYLKIEYLGG